jgi:hypothetical protein
MNELGKNHELLGGSFIPFFKNIIEWLLYIKTGSRFYENSSY